MCSCSLSISGRSDSGNSSSSSFSFLGSRRPSVGGLARMGFTTPTEGMVTGMGGRAGVTPATNPACVAVTPPSPPPLSFLRRNTAPCSHGWAALEAVSLEERGSLDPPRLTCDDSRGLGSHDSLGQSPQGLGQSQCRGHQSRCGKGTQHRCSGHCFLSCNLGCGCSCGHSSSWWEASRCGRCKQGHGGCDSLAHPQILATQVKEVHGRHGILRRLGLLIFCRAGAAVRATVPGRPGPPTSARPSSPMKP